MKVLESIKLFLEHCQFEKKLSLKTIEAYETDLQQFKSFLKEQSVKSIDQIDKHIIKLYVQELSKFEPRTIKRKIASAKSYLNFLEFEDYILVNPFRKVKIRIKEPLQIPTVLDFEEVKQLFQHLKQQSELIPNKASLSYGEKLRDLSVLELLFATGVRVSELCGLRVEDINLDSGNMLIRGKGNKERIVQICNPETTKILKDYYQFFETQIQRVGFFLSVGWVLPYHINQFASSSPSTVKK